MNHKQYSDIQRCIGVLEGIGASFPADAPAAGMYYDTLELLNCIIEEMKPDIGNEESRLDGESSPTKEELIEPRLYVKYDYNTDKPIGYAFGAPWVQQALYMGDLQYPTPEDAEAAWERMQKEADNEENE